MRKKKLRNLSPANLETMNIIWEKGEVTVNDIAEAINEKELTQWAEQPSMSRWAGTLRKGR